MRDGCVYVREHLPHAAGTCFTTGMHSFSTDLRCHWGAEDDSIAPDAPAQRGLSGKRGKAPNDSAAFFRRTGLVR